jgi:hypothetical protein
MTGGVVASATMKPRSTSHHRISTRLLFAHGWNSGGIASCAGTKAVAML